MDENEATFIITNGNEKKSFFGLYLCNPRHVSHRIIILFLTCFITFGSYFCYDNPSALQTVMMRDLSLSYTEYMTLYSWYSWPNVFMCFVGGFLIDNFFGIQFGTALFGAMTVVGQVLLAVGVYVNRLWLMDLARCIFGIGAESLAVAQNTYAARWFKDKELNIVFGLQISISRIGSTINSNTMEQLYKQINIYHDGRFSLFIALLIASLTCVLSFGFCILLGYLDRRAARLIKSFLLESDKTDIRCSHLLNLEPCLWILCAICFVIYSAILPFVSLAQGIFVKKYGFSIEQANLANSLIYVISAVVSPIFGFGVDKFGRNLSWLLSGVLLSTLCHFLTAFTVTFTPFAITFVLGLAYSLIASSLWGLVAILIPTKRQGTAYGLMQAIMNLGLGTVAIIAGEILDHFGYFALELFFIILLLIGVMFVVYLFIWDSLHGNIMNMKSSKRAKLNENNS